MTRAWLGALAAALVFSTAGAGCGGTEEEGLPPLHGAIAVRLEAVDGTVKDGVARFRVTWPSVSVNAASVWIDGKKFYTFERPLALCELDVRDVEPGPHEFSLRVSTPYGLVASAVEVFVQAVK